MLMDQVLVLNLQVCELGPLCVLHIPTQHGGDPQGTANPQKSRLDLWLPLAGHSADLGRVLSF